MASEFDIYDDTTVISSDEGEDSCDFSVLPSKFLEAKREPESRVQEYRQLVTTQRYKTRMVNSIWSCHDVCNVFKKRYLKRISKQKNYTYKEILKQIVAEGKRQLAASIKMVQMNNSPNRLITKEKSPVIVDLSDSAPNSPEELNICEIKEKKKEYIEESENVVVEKIVQEEKPNLLEVAVLEAEILQPENMQPLENKMIDGRAQEEKQEIMSVKKPIFNSNRKRARSLSPVLMSNAKREKKESTDTNSSNFHSKIDSFFKDYNEIITEYMNKTNESLDENISQIMEELDYIDFIIERKESELNKMIFLKRLKKEVISRLLRKKLMSELQNTPIDPDLIRPNFNRNRMDVKKIIEDRANMSKMDLLKELTSTEQFQRFLMTNVFNSYKKDFLEGFPTTSKIEPPTEQLEAFYKWNPTGFDLGREKKATSSNDIFRPKLGNAKNPSEKNSSNRFPGFQAYNFHNGSKRTLLNSINDNSNNEVSITPIFSDSRISVKPKIHEGDFLRTALHQGTQHQNQNIKKQNQTVSYILYKETQEERDYIPKYQDVFILFQESQQKTEDINQNQDSTLNTLFQKDVPTCQHCGINKAKFVCAGCQFQWYCSRACQINAWDDHSEYCDG